MARPEHTGVDRRGQWSAGHCAALACQIEVAIPKPGNVHRGADFADTTLYDFLAAGQVLGQVIDETAASPIGATILESVRRTRALTGNNPNLGIVLLIVPLARLAGAVGALSVDRMESLLKNLDARDARDMAAAIRLASPGGLGTVAEQDVTRDEMNDLMGAMRLAAGRDAIAAEYASGFAGILERHLPMLRECLDHWGRLDRAVIALHVHLIAAHGDSLIARKGGLPLSREAASRARRCVEALDQGWESFQHSLNGLDFWMRSDGNRRNPGTTADLIAATLFAGLWSGQIELAPGLGSPAADRMAGPAREENRSIR